MLFFKKKKEIERPHKLVSSQPLTLPELDTQIKNRIDVIQKEFTDSFNFIKKYPKTVSFFGSARTIEAEDDYKNAYRLARRVSELGYAVITGGGPGIMAAANKGAFEEKGASVGFTINLPREQSTNSFVNDSLNFNYFFARKVALTYAAEAYVYFPGGFGTLDELFEILTLVQTNKIEKVPIILFGSYFWLPFKNFLLEYLGANGKIDSTDINLFIITDSLDEAMRIIRAAPIREAN
jgi:uncharacterized protein (TIGR00730 family)